MRPKCGGFRIDRLPRRRFCHAVTAVVLCLWHVTAARAEPSDNPAVVIGSKKFTESVILGELAVQLTQHAGARATHRRELGGTRILWAGLLVGDLDLYPEYTGTLAEELLSERNLRTTGEIREVLAEFGLEMSEPLGFNNTYAIGMREDRAAELGIRTISDLATHPQLVLAFGNEFMDRGDGWPSLRDRYRLGHRNVRGMDHDLGYRALNSGAIDAMDLYVTDAEISGYGLRVLEDDLRHFVAYHAVFLYRKELVERAPGVIAALRKLEGKITDTAMQGMNKRAKIDKVPESLVAADFLATTLNIRTEIKLETGLQRLGRRTLEHLKLVVISMAGAILLAVPLGILAARRPSAGQGILGVVGIVQTIPSLALLVFMIPLLGIGEPAAIVALFLYSLLPIVRNTYTGLHDIAPHMRESADALGLAPGAKLRLIELPMASRAILAGIKTATVINIGTATLGALIGAGGYGQPILTGIRLDDMGLILEGAIPAAALAILIQGLFELAELCFVPKGLRLQRTA